MKADVRIVGDKWVIVNENGTQVSVQIKGEYENRLANAVMQTSKLVRKLFQEGVTEVTLTGFRNPRLPLTEAEWVFLEPKNNEPLEAARREALRVAEELGIVIKQSSLVVDLDELGNVLRSNSGSAKGKGKGQDLFDE